MRVALVTGASSGLGREFALQLNRRAGEDRIEEIWLCARREERLRELAAQLESACRVFPLDLEETESRKLLAESLKKAGAELVWLVNSAGLGRVGNCCCDFAADCQRTIRLNCEALTELSLLASPYFIRGSRLIQVASVAAFLPQPGFAVYAASKAYVLSFSRALAREWRGRGISVLACCPNPMETEFFVLAGKNKEAKVDKIKSLGLEKAEHVARMAILSCLKNRDISVTAPLARFLQLISRLLPHPLILWLEGKLGFWKTEEKA